MSATASQLALAGQPSSVNYDLYVMLCVATALHVSLDTSPDDIRTRW